MMRWDMAYRVVMPKLSDTMEEGKILRWIKKEGDRVEVGDALVEIATDKADIEVEAYASGMLRKIVIPEGKTVAVGTLIAIIAEEDEDITGLEKEIAREGFHRAEKVEEEPYERIEQETSARIKASPLAMRLAKEKGIDISKVKGTGPFGRIVQRDIEAYLAGAEAASVEMEPIFHAEEPYLEEELTLMRKTIARKMAQSKSTIPHFYLTSEIDMDKAVELRDYLNSLGGEIKISFTDMIVKAVAKALKRYPRLNASFTTDKIKVHRGINIGVAVALEEGLITPVIRACDIKGLGQIAAEIRDLTEKARARKLMPEEYSGATFTVSNLGMYDVENFSAIINPPEGAILAVGAVSKKAIVTGDGVGIGYRMKVTLSCDHRIIDGATGAKFLQEFKRMLENPILLAI